jgi:hypothetical protein
VLVSAQLIVLSGAVPVVSVALQLAPVPSLMLTVPHH